ncbi:MAG: glycosyltransferase, partial [Geobacteraceae bacterium]|nr:glycosyltransferase [Geobacteraceae bacterium]
MRPQIIRVDICIATFKRPELLAELLETINRQKLDETLLPRVIIADNDHHATARSTVDAFKKETKFPVVYDVEPVQNISLARNRCLSHANGDVVVFVDDDEFVAENWLSELVKALYKFNADAVFGPVLPVYPDSVPVWIRKGRFFDRPRFASGTAVKSYGTGNTALRTVFFVGENTSLFSPVYGLTGGEDHEFFTRVSKHGGKFVWCDSSIVYEKVPNERQTVRFLLKRAFRGGQAYASVHLAYLSIWQKFGWLLYRSGLVLISLFSVIATLPFDKSLLVKALQKLLSNLGQLSILTRY